LLMPPPEADERAGGFEVSRPGRARHQVASL
jgi:hypothetical protein